MKDAERLIIAWQAASPMAEFITTSDDALEVHIIRKSSNASLLKFTIVGGDRALRSLEIRINDK